MDDLDLDDFSELVREDTLNVILARIHNNELFIQILHQIMVSSSAPYLLVELDHMVSHLDRENNRMVCRVRSALVYKK